MAFQPPVQPQGDSQSREKANRKILEQLEEQKKRLRLSTHGPPPANPNTPINFNSSPTAINATTPTSPQVGPPMTRMENMRNMTPAQRSALQHAHEHSAGYFVPQSSSFGNLILPVLPRFDKL